MPPKGPPKPDAGASTPNTSNPRQPPTTTFSHPLTSTLLTALQSAPKTNSSHHNSTFTSKAMLALPPMTGKTNQDILDPLKELLRTGHLVLLKDPSATSSSTSATPLYRLRQQRAVDSLRGLDGTHKRIYSMIEGSGRHGIWSKPLTRMADVHQAMFNKIMRTLENRKLVKQMRNVKAPSRKMFLLYELEPMLEATGGPWYTDGELDEALVEEVSNIVVRWIEQKSWRTGPRSLLNAPKGEDWEAAFALYVNENKKPLLQYPPEYEDYPSAAELATDLEAAGAVEGKDIRTADVQFLLDVLEFDGRIEKVGWKREEDEEDEDEDAGDMMIEEDVDAVPTQITGDDTGIPTGQDGEEDPTSDAELPEDNNSQSIEQAQDQDSEPEVDPEASYEPTESRPKSDRKRKRVAGSSPQPKAQKKGKKGQTDVRPRKPDSQQDDTNIASDSKNGINNHDLHPSKPHLVPTYRSVRRPHTQDEKLGPGSAFAETPCSRCPVFDLCQEGGPVNAKDCGYFEGWLRGDAGAAGALGEVRVDGGRLDY